MITVENVVYPPIPREAGQVQDWQNIPITENGRPDPLIPLGPLSQGAENLIASSIYFGEHSNSPYANSINRLEGSLLTLFARQSVVQRLLVAEQLLPAGYHLLVFDTYRLYQVQKSLHGFYMHKLREKYPAMDNERLRSETQKYVSLPSLDPAHPSPHNTGGSVDLAIVRLDHAHEQQLLQIRSRLSDANLAMAQRVGLEIRLSAVLRRHARMLDFGTAFDHGGEKSALAYYESKIAAGERLTANDRLACYNRRLLFGVMTQAGFQPYYAEWWHFNAPESQMGAAAAGLANATFGAVGLDARNIAHENTRLKIRQEILSLQREGGRAVARTACQAEILTALRETGDPTLAENWPAEIIAPAGE